MQLTRPHRTRAALAGASALAVIVASLAGTRSAAANTEAASRLTVFREPSTGNAGITVIHPQVDASAAVSSTFNINAGYEVDIVSGATPRTFAPSSGVDAITAATKFSDVRQEAKGGFAFNRASSGLAASYSYGWESDYKSQAVSAFSHSDLVDHNFTLAIGYTHNFDTVCDANNAAAAGDLLSLQPLASSAHCFQSGMADVTTHKLSIDTFEPSLTWTATPRFVIQAGSTIQILDGFQSNPYRAVLIGSQHRTPQERMPNFRQRYAVFGRGAYALPDARASLTGGIRLYRDSWAVMAETAELNYNQYVLQNFLFTLRGRYHQQTGASFYRTSREYQTLGPGGLYWTGDRELSPMSNFLASAKLAYVRRPGQERNAWFSELEFSGKFEGLLYHLDSPDAPNFDRKVAYIGQTSFALRF